MNAITPSALVWEGDRAPLAKAFVSAQMASEAVKKASTNPAFKSKYADLAGVVEAVLPALNAAGVGVMQSPTFDGEWVSVETMLLHESGASVASTLRLRPSRTDPQGVGSAITYGRRYSLLAMTGAAPEDDDGNAASGPQDDRRHSREPAPPAMSGACLMACDLLRASKTAEELKSFWTMNKDGLKRDLEPAEYAEVVTTMQAQARRLAPNGKAAPPAPPPAEDFGIGADEIPF